MWPETRMKSKRNNQLTEEELQSIDAQILKFAQSINYLILPLNPFDLLFSYKDCCHIYGIYDISIETFGDYLTVTGQSKCHVYRIESNCGIRKMSFPFDDAIIPGVYYAFTLQNYAEKMKILETSDDINFIIDALIDHGFQILQTIESNRKE
jgi:hypothetical protein